MKTKLQESMTQAKEQIDAMPKKRKILIVSIAAGVILFAVIMTLALNGNFSGYKVLYRNIESSEASQVYTTLKELGAAPQMNSAGEVMVPTSEYDVWLLQLAEKGFPRTAPAYDIFSNHSGMTSTEAERKQWLLYQLQDRIQETLSRMQAVNSAVVTITVPESSDYIWEQANNTEKASASILMMMAPGSELETAQVGSIKNLVAASVPKMEAEDVILVDSATSMELEGGSAGGEISVSQNLEYEQMVQQQMEDNIKRLLSPRYGASGVVPVVKASINYDKMMTERMEMQEQPEGGFPTHTEGEYTLNGKETVGGIVGEETNTDDIPAYGYNGAGEDEDKTYFRWNTDIDYSYIKTQIEKGNASLERATVSVMVDEANLTQARRQELVSLISRSVDIEPELIFVSAINANEAAVEPEDPTQQGNGFLGLGLDNMLFWICVAAGGCVLLAVIFIVLLGARRKRRNRKRMEEEAAALAAAETERHRVEQEISSYKKQLSDAAHSESNAKDEAIMDEVRDFAKTNPEITANLLRSWMKEDG